MSVKSDILQKLIDANGEYVSGEMLGKALFCSRNAVWKAINALKKEGYDISAITNKGYALLHGDVLTADGITRHLSEQCRTKLPLKIEIYDSVTSTNDVQKARAESGEAEGLVIISNEQTKGKGRRGRSYFSPKSGIYLSILLRPKINATDSLYITTSAAVAITQAIERICKKDCGIKWVNDIFLDGLKICGILTEASVDFETGGLQYAVLGIGINLANPADDFPAELKGVAGAIFDKLPKENDIKNRLCAEILNCFFDFYNNLPVHDFMAEYKRRSVILGKKINVIQNGCTTKATAVDIDDGARLIVQYEDGSTKPIQTGEVSVRLV